MIGNQAPTAAQSTRKGLAFPFQAGSTGFPQPADPSAVLYNRIVALLTTGTNERVMRPDLGINIYSYVFSNMTAIEQARLALDVAQTIEQWEPSVVVQNVTTEVQEQRDGKRITIIDVTFREGGQQHSLQVPVVTPSVQGS